MVRCGDCPVLFPLTGNRLEDALVDVIIGVICGLPGIALKRWV